ncbi:hypothetical protein GQX74_010419 [Glossina fuscipes]|nr:hypothetical protein GQX74_010419 [Glossina fuscipes]
MCHASLINRTLKPVEEKGRKNISLKKNFLFTDNSILGLIIEESYFKSIWGVMRSHIFVIEMTCTTWIHTNVDYHVVAEHEMFLKLKFTAPSRNLYEFQKIALKRQKNKFLKIENYWVLMTGQALGSIMCDAGPHGMIMMMGITVVVTMMAIRIVLIADADTAHTVTRVTITKHTTQQLEQSVQLKGILNTLSLNLKSFYNICYSAAQTYGPARHQLMKEHGLDQSESLEALISVHKQRSLQLIAGLPAHHLSPLLLYSIFIKRDTYTKLDIDQVYLKGLKANL